ncbi:MAG: YbaB/EbfC family nucleoid-associated protein [Chloroflexaceae bacterium]|nr:YbaB/EbfC family nucleoid-associated protein [Chloroflexaceae bacterium]
MNQQQLMKQVQQMQQQMQKIQAELGETIVEGTAGGGAVIVTMNGHRDIQAIKLNPEIVDPDDVEMLQDLILAAINDGVRVANELQEERLGPLAKGMPGLF